MASRSAALLHALRSSAARRKRRKSASLPPEPEPTKVSTGLGWFLIVWIILMAFAWAWRAYALVSTMQAPADGAEPWSGALVWAPPILAALAAINVIGLLLLLVRRRLGLYLLVLGTLASAALNHALGFPIPMMLLALFGFVVLAIALIPRRRALR